MERTPINGVELALDVRGTGETVLLIHGGVIADAYAPLLTDQALTKRYRLITYHRRGYGGSARPDGPTSIEEQAADARVLLRYIGVDQAHVVGHSYGGAVALQLALDAPEAVHSLALLEPALMMVPGAPEFFEAVGPVVARYQAGDRAAAIDGFMQAVNGPDYRTPLDKTLPDGWFEQAIADADTLFQGDLASLEPWTFTEALARRITQPVLSVVGAESAPLFQEGSDLLQRWLPQTETFALPGAPHALQLVNPTGMAEALSGFFVRHPLPVTA